MFLQGCFPCLTDRWIQPTLTQLFSTPLLFHLDSEYRHFCHKRGSPSGELQPQVLWLQKESSFCISSKLYTRIVKPFCSQRGQIHTIVLWSYQSVAVLYPEWNHKKSSSLSRSSVYYKKVPAAFFRATISLKQVEVPKWNWAGGKQ